MPQQAIMKPTATPMQGYLKKLKSNARFVGSWNKRFFSINPATRELLYFKSESSSKPSGGIDLDSIVAVKMFDKCQFQIESSTRNFFLKAATEDSAHKWHSVLQHYVGALNLYRRRVAGKSSVKPSAPVNSPPRAAAPAPVSSGKEAEVESKEAAEHKEAVVAGSPTSSTASISSGERSEQSPRDSLDHQEVASKEEEEIAATAEPVPVQREVTHRKSSAFAGALQSEAKRPQADEVDDIITFDFGDGADVGFASPAGKPRGRQSLQKSKPKSLHEMYSSKNVLTELAFSDDDDDDEDDYLPVAKPVQQQRKSVASESKYNHYQPSSRSSRQRDSQTAVKTFSRPASPERESEDEVEQPTQRTVAADKGWLDEDWDESDGSEGEQDEVQGFDAPVEMYKSRAAGRSLHEMAGVTVDENFVEDDWDA